MTCKYSLSSAVDTGIESSVKWIFGAGMVDTSLDWISTGGESLTFSPSDSWEYTCQLAITEVEGHHVTVQDPVQSLPKRLTVGSKRDSESYGVSIETIYLHNAVPEPDIDVTLSHDPPLYAGTGVTFLYGILYIHFL